MSAITVLIKQLQTAIAQDNLEGVFSLLNKTLLVSSARKADAILLESIFNKQKTDNRNGLVTIEAQGANFAILSKNILAYMATITDADITKITLGGAPIHERHSLTCDRIDQNDEFEVTFDAKKVVKTRFYYLFGDKMQSHESLVQRFKYEREGQFLSSDGSYNSNIKVFLPDSIKPTPSKLPDALKRNALRELFARFNIPVNDQQLIDQNNITALLQSPAIVGLGPQDFVFVMFCIDDFTWNKDIIPDIVKWFIATFCAVELPPNAPTFCFFFAILYKESNIKVQQEVAAILTPSELIGALPKLDKIEPMWVEEWFNRHDQLSPQGIDIEQFIAKEFGQSDTYNMRDIEPVFRRLIDNYNAS